MDNSTKILQERAKLEELLEKYADVKNREDAVEYTKVLMTLIFNFKMVGYVYEYYADDITYITADARTINSPEGIAVENMAWIAAFTDFKIDIEEGFASGDFENEFKSYIRYYCTGTNNGPSIYGRPTFKKLENKDYIGESLFTFRKVDDKWKIAKEYTIKSNYKIEKLIRENQPMVEEV